MRDSHRSIVRTIANRPARAITCAFLAVALVAGPTLPAAYAVSSETLAAIDQATRKIDESAAAYNDAVAKLEALQAQIDETETAIDELEGQIPEQKEAASRAMRDMYKYQAGSNPLVGVMVNSGSLSDFMTSCAYMTQIQDSNTEAIDELNAMQSELEQKKGELNAAKQQLEQEKQIAEQALAQAQQERQAAQDQAEAEAAAELAALIANTAPAEGEGENSDNQFATANESNQTADVTVDSDVDWTSSDREQFVAEWGGRIDAYLAGSPLAGYGNLFAEASWDYGVDPRWSPAIACIESTKGTYCFRPHNAWGWMGASFDSWEEAIPAHVSYLRSMYGPTLTPAAAQRYCPPTWQDWYNKVGREMNRI